MNWQFAQIEIVAAKFYRFWHEIVWNPEREYCKNQKKYHCETTF